LFSKYFILKPLKQKKGALYLFLLVSVFLFFSSNIKERFLIEFNSNITNNVFEAGTSKNNEVNNISIYQAWTQDKFKQNDYFTGTAFRVYQIRIFKEMLEEDAIFFKGYGLNASSFRIKEKGQEHTVFLRCNT
jgi:hypothetical protein